MNNGTLVISLDFELLWGVFDKVNWREKQEYFWKTRDLIPKILQLFEKYDIACTWATVGMLFNENWEDWTASIPEVLPDYQNQKLSAYKFGKEIISDDTKALCFAPTLIQKIKNTSNQEIATHTYSHYYCLEKGQSIRSFEADLKMAITKSKLFDIKLKSLVFPRNQFNTEYLDICKKLGIKNVRSNPSSWYWRNTEQDKLVNKIFRTGDAYLGFNNKSYKVSNRDFSGDDPFSQKASRLLRPFSHNNALNSLKIKRIKNEMEMAAKNAEIYHLWWHPHNFGDDPDENLRDLEELLVYFQDLNKKYGIISRNMEQVGELNSK